jgi:hypothetical protein
MLDVMKIDSKMLAPFISSKKDIYKALANEGKSGIDFMSEIQL